MIAVLLPPVALVASVLSLRNRVGRRWSLHVVAISAALLVITLARAASSRNRSQCALDLAPSARDATAKVHR
jgi:hypothetical protein